MLRKHSLIEMGSLLGHREGSVHYPLTCLKLFLVQERYMLVIGETHVDLKAVNQIVLI